MAALIQVDIFKCFTYLGRIDVSIFNFAVRTEYRFWQKRMTLI